MSRLSWNRTPYFDDFNSQKNYLRVLFRPGHAVQTRELNQIQSIFQNQIEKFANHIFKNGSRVSNARSNNVSCQYVRLQSLSKWVTDVGHPNGYSVSDLTRFPTGMSLFGTSSGITALLVKSVNAEMSDPPTLYVIYTGTAIDGETTAFIPGETIQFIDSNNIPVYSVQVKCPGCIGVNDLDTISPTGQGQIFSIDSGIFYFEGMFIESLKQDIIISKYGEVSNCKIGFDFIQTIADSSSDNSLLDNALGYPNQTAPGADRYKVALVLTKRTLNSIDGDNFILLAKFENNQYTYFKADSEYSEIMDMIAKRTYETNGNYTYKPFNLRFIEDKALTVSDPNGYSVDGDEDYIRAVLSPGVAYVNGYRHETTNESNIKIYKARDTKKTTGYVHTFEDRTYIYLQPLRSYSAYPNKISTVSNTDGTLIDVYDGPFNGSKLPTGTKIGSFKVYDVRPDSAKGTINALGVVSSIKIINSGSGYTSAPDITITGGGGTGATATAVISNGQVSSIIVNTPGSNFTFTPTVTIANGGGTGATAKAIIQGPAVFKYYIYDLIMSGNNKLNQGLSFVDTTQTQGFKAVPYLDDVTIYNPNKTELIWRISRDHIKSFRSISDEENPDPPGTLSIMIRRKMAATVLGGVVSFTSNTNEFFQAFDPNSTVAIITDNNAGAGVIHTVDLSIPGRFSRTDTSITITVGDELDVGTGTDMITSGNTLTLIHNVLRTNGQEDSKEVAETQEITGIVPTASSFKIYKTSSPVQYVADVFEILYVYEYDPGSPSIVTDITNKFTLNTGANETGYYDSELQLTSSHTIDSGKRWKYKVKYYNHNHSKNMGYFTIDSYKDLIANNIIDYEDNPQIQAKNNSIYPLFSSFDFRPTVLNGVSLTGNVIPVIGTTAIFDLTYYLKRIDLLCINKDGQMYVKKGIPSDTPFIPIVDSDAMALYEIYFDPYTYSINDISTKYLENKRYTMRDIGKLESRIESLEYYTALNLLEKSAEDMNIKDANGFDRFKNGFVVDNFQDFQASDIKNNEFRISLDRNYNEMRPQFIARNTKLAFIPGESTAKLLGKMAMIDFNNVVVDQQIFATKSLSVNPYFQFSRKGILVLSPNNDGWSDSSSLSNLTMNVDSGLDALKQVTDSTKMLGSIWGSWSHLNSAINTPANLSDSKNPSQVTNVNRTTDSRTDSYSLNTKVSDLSFNPYMRATTIQFYATQLKANTKVWAFFDGKPVTDYVRSVGGRNGSQLVTDQFGQLAGFFDCPEKMFFTGEKEFILTSDENLTGDPNLETTYAKTTFYSGGIDNTRTSTTMNVVSPITTNDQVSGIKVKLSSTTASSSRCNPGYVWNGSTCVTIAENNQSSQWKDVPVGDTGTSNRTRSSNDSNDPIAQSFKLDHDCHITGLDVFFAEIDPNPGEIFFQIRLMENGYPSHVILGEKKINSSTLTSSDNSQTPFHVDFDFPVFCSASNDYCFVIGGWSPDTKLWVARLGDQIVDNPGKILETQPSIGVSFRSQNGDTWNAEQLEDVKYNLYGARFKTTSLTAVFEHESKKMKLGRDPFEAESASNFIRVTVPNHGFSVNDQVAISLLETDWINITVTTGQVNIGQVVTTSSGFTGTICDYRVVGSQKSIRMNQRTGTFLINTPFTCALTDVPVNDNYLLSKLNFTSSQISTSGYIRYNQVSGTLTSTYPVSINGIPITELNKTHIIQTVDSLDSFVIQVVSSATASGSFGGEEVYSDYNEKYEVFNVSGNYLPYKSSETFTYRGIGYNPINGPFAAVNNTQMKEQIIKLNHDIHLGQPHKIVSDSNEGVGRKVRIVGTFTAPDEWTSPIINTDTFSLTAVSHRVSWITSSQMAVAPNASSQFISEYHPVNGVEEYKYVTETINLVNPASDLVIIFEVYKDINSDFDVFVKFLPPYETESLDAKKWMRVVGYDKTHNSVDLFDRVEIEMTLSEMKLDTNTTGDTIVQINWNQLPYNEFSSFKVKIVGKAKNPAKPPLFKNFRAIAVT